MPKQRIVSYFVSYNYTQPDGKAMFGDANITVTSQGRLSLSELRATIRTWLAKNIAIEKQLWLNDVVLDNIIILNIVKEEAL